MRRGALLLTGCRQDMHDQPRYKPLAGTDFFGDGRSARPVVEGTVARGPSADRQARYTGKVDDQEVDYFPFPITRADLAARPGALQHLLLAVSQPDRRRQRNGGAARIPAGRLLSHAKG